MSMEEKLQGMQVQLLLLLIVWKFTRFNINEAPTIENKNTEPDYIARVNGIYFKDFKRNIKKTVQYIKNALFIIICMMLSMQYIDFSQPTIFALDKTFVQCCCCLFVLNITI